MVDMVPLGSAGHGQAVSSGGVGPMVDSASPLDSSLHQPSYAQCPGQVMTEEQLETLRRQISVYATICKQLVEMHKASLSQQSSLPGAQNVSLDQLTGTLSLKTTTRQRWSPSQSQLQYLERLFDQGTGTPNKQRIKEIVAELSQHGQIAETNVYNWFQNRKARAKRKQQLVSLKDGESEVDTDVESPKEKWPRQQEVDMVQDDSGTMGDMNGTGSSDGGGHAVQPQHFDPQDATSSVLLLSEAKPNISSVSRGPGFESLNVPQGLKEDRDGRQRCPPTMC
ncbi:hypothetical protein CY35_18G063500 [Sphagnum magellanicum]|nr:hypothetical protein CY35_18G063500 [Sphagnum magellanicum]